jgi:hypothetical protein
LAIRFELRPERAHGSLATANDYWFTTKESKGKPDGLTLYAYTGNPLMLEKFAFCAIINGVPGANDVSRIQVFSSE